MTAHHENQTPQPPNKKNWWLTFPGVVTLILLLAVGYYLITEHRAHLYNILPLLFLLLCPLMHLMHGRHHGHNHNKDKKNKD